MPKSLPDLAIRIRSRVSTLERSEGSGTYGEESDREGEDSNEDEDEDAQNAPEGVPESAAPSGLRHGRRRRELGQHEIVERGGAR